MMDDEICIEDDGIFGDVYNLNSRGKFKTAVISQNVDESAFPLTLNKLRVIPSSTNAGKRSATVSRDQPLVPSQISSLGDGDNVREEGPSLKDPMEKAPALTKTPKLPEVPRTNLATKPRCRKIPGPSGLLPPLGPGQTVDSVEEQSMAAILTKAAELRKDITVSSQGTQGTQGTVDPFNTSWRSLIRDLNSGGHSSVLDRFNVKWVLDKANRSELPRREVPLLCALLGKVTVCGNLAITNFTDKTGEIMGTIQRKVFDDHSHRLHEGSTVVLRKANVLSASSRYHYLNVVPANVVCVYSDIDDTPSQCTVLNKALTELEDDHIPLDDPLVHVPETPENAEEKYWGEEKDDDWMLKVDLTQCDVPHLKSNKRPKL